MTEEFVPWTTLQGANANDEIKTPASEYPDRPEATDAIYGVKVSRISASTTLTIQLQTSLTKDDEDFVTMGSAITVTGGTVLPLYTTVVARIDDTTPHARFDRVVVSGDAAAWSGTLRIVAVYKTR